MKTALPQRCGFCGAKLSKTPASGNTPACQEREPYLRTDVSTFSLVITLFLLLSAVARIIFGTNPLSKYELTFLIGALGVAGALTGISYLRNRRKDD